MTPIRAEKWKRITFFYTLGHLFNQAENINELVVKTDEREILWKNLRERALTAGTYGEKQETILSSLDPAIIKFLGSIAGIDSQDEELFEI